MIKAVLISPLVWRKESVTCAVLDCAFDFIYLQVARDCKLYTITKAKEYVKSKIKDFTLYQSRLNSRNH